MQESGPFSKTSSLPMATRSLNSCITKYHFKGSREALKFHSQRYRIQKTRGKLHYRLCHRFFVPSSCCLCSSNGKKVRERRNIFHRNHQLLTRNMRGSFGRGLKVIPIRSKPLSTLGIWDALPPFSGKKFGFPSVLLKSQWCNRRPQKSPLNITILH